MKAIRLYYHRDCQRCARLARLDQRLDWLNRLEVSTADPKCGPVRVGEIVVEELNTGRLFKGARALRLIFRHLPPYWPALALLRIPAFRRSMDRSLSGCDGAGCLVPVEASREAEHCGR